MRLTKNTINVIKEEEGEYEGDNSAIGIKKQKNRDLP